MKYRYKKNLFNITKEIFAKVLLSLAIFLTFTPLMASPNDDEFNKLPVGVQTWYKYETEYLSREVNPNRIASPKQNDQDIFYAPESKNIFDVFGYWLPVDQLHSTLDQADGGLDQLFFRTREGKREALFLIHPESIDLYKNLISQAQGQEHFRAMATSSSRSLLMWKAGDESHPFIGKLSLNKKIGYVTRTILDAETIHSVLTNRILNGPDSAQEKFPENTLFMREFLGSFPIGQKDNGMIIREITNDLVTGYTTYAPLFSLYGGLENGMSPLLLKLAAAEDMSAEKFIEDRILKPFSKIWVDLAVDHGITMEPHAQNVLLEIVNEKFTGRFIFRDFGGININWNYRRKLGLSVPDESQIPKGSPGNFAKDHDEILYLSLYTYFEGGFLHNVENAFKVWEEKGLKSKENHPDGWTSEKFRAALMAEIAKRNPQTPILDSSYKNLSEIVKVLRDDKLNSIRKIQQEKSLSDQIDPVRGEQKISLLPTSLELSCQILFR